jgi:hypothetical protein
MNSKEALLRMDFDHLLTRGEVLSVGLRDNCMAFILSFIRSLAKAQSAQSAF